MSVANHECLVGGSVSGRTTRAAVSRDRAPVASEENLDLVETLRHSTIRPVLTRSWLLPRTPAAIARRLNKEMTKIVQDQEVLLRITSFGYAFGGAETPDEVNQRLRVDRDMWSTLQRNWLFSLSDYYLPTISFSLQGGPLLAFAPSIRAQ